MTYPAYPQPYRTKTDSKTFLIVGLILVALALLTGWVVLTRPISIQERVIAGLVAAVLGTLGVVALNGYWYVRRRYVAITPQGIEISAGKTLTVITWSEIAWVDVMLAWSRSPRSPQTIAERSAPKAGTWIRLAPQSQDFGGRPDLERLRKAGLPTPFTHAIRLPITEQPNRSPETDTVANALAAFAANRFSGLVRENADT